MPEIQFASVAPGIAMFNANMAQGDMQRRQAEEDAIRRVQFEQAQGADAAQRAAAAGYFAGQPAANLGQPAPVPDVATPTQVPNPAATTPVVTPTPSMNPADNPDYGGVPPRAAPAPNMPPRAGVDVPATVSTPPGIAAFSTQPVSGPAPRDRFADMASTLSKAPGTGAQLMNMVGTHMTATRAQASEARKLQAEGNKEMLSYLKDGDVAMAQQAAKQYGIQIPDEVWKNRKLVMNLRLGATLAKTMGVKDEHAVHFVDGFTHALAAGLPEDQAVIAGLKEVPKGGIEVKHTVVGQGDKVYGIGPHGETMDLGIKARPQKWEFAGAGGAGGGSKQQQYAEWRIKTLTAAGMPDKQAQQLVAGGAGTRPINQQQRVSLAKGLMSAKGAGGITPLYKTLNEALKAVDEAITSPMPQTPEAGAPSAAAATAPAAGAGKVFKFDAQGNEITE